MKYIPIVASLLLAGCAAPAANTSPPGPGSSQPAPGQTPLQKLAADLKDLKSKFNNDLAQLRKNTLADLTAAKSNADSQNPPDKVSSMCYAQLITNINALPALPTSGTGAASPGPILLFQEARDVTRQADADDLKIACGPLFLDEVDDARKLFDDITKIVALFPK